MGGSSAGGFSNDRIAAGTSDGIGRDLRHALRGFRRTPTFTIVAVATLAVGIAATTVLFGVVRGVLLTPLPVRSQDGVVVAWNRHVTRNLGHFPFSLPAYEHVRDASRALAGAAAVEGYGWGLLPVRDESGITAIRRARVLGDFTGVLGIKPALGRAITADDDVPGGPRVAMISSGFWRRSFGGDRDVIGRTLEIAGMSHTIVGVMPEGFDYPRGTELWKPLRPDYPDWAKDPPHLELDLVARLAPGATVETARAGIAALLKSTPDLAEEYEGTITTVRTLPDVTFGDLRATILVLFGAAMLVLLIAGVNVANLLLVRGAARQRQLAVRVALGASRWRIVRQLLAETTVLAAMSVLAGLALSLAAVRLLLPLAPADLARVDSVRLDGPALLFALAMTAFVVTVAGLVPGMRTARIEPGAAFRGGAARFSTSPRDASAGVMVGAQVAIAIAVFFAATQLVRSLARMQGLDRGFDGDDIVLLNFSAPYPLFEVPPAFVSNLERVTERLRGRAGVIEATPTLSPPLVGVGGYDAITPIEGQTMEEAVRTNPYLSIEVVASAWFDIMRVPIRRGRAFADSDDDRAPPVVIVNESTARALWPGQDPIGKRLNAPWPGMKDIWWTVIGVVPDTRYRQMLEPRPSLYFAHRQFNLFVTPNLLVRTRRLSADLLPAVQAAFDEVDPSLRVLSATPLSTLLDAPLARPRFGSAVLSAFALISLLLAAVGVFAVVAALVGARTREFGIRMALGATGGDVWRLVVRRGMLVALAGAAAGLFVSLAMARVVASLLFDVGPRDPISLAIAPAAVLIAAFAACSAPAARAARVDPAATLRSE